MKLAAAVIALVVFAIPATAAAQDEVTACSAGYVLVDSAGGPLCVNPIYLTGWEDDPATCQWGFYQGSCVPVVYAELPPVVFAPEAYAYQQIPMQTPAPVVTVLPVANHDDEGCLIARPC